MYLEIHGWADFFEYFVEKSNVLYTNKKKFFYKFVFLITRCRHGHNLLGMNSFCLFMWGFSLLILWWAYIPCVIKVASPIAV